MTTENVPTPPAAAPEREADYFDFDAWHAEQYGATIPFKILGEVYQIPGDCDAALLLKMQRMEIWAKQVSMETVLAEMEERAPRNLPLPNGLTQEDLDEYTVEGICRALAGDDNVDAWMAAKIPSRMLAAAGRRLYAIYAGQDADEAIGLGKAPTPKAPKKPQDRQRKKPKART